MLYSRGPPCLLLGFPRLEMRVGLRSLCTLVVDATLPGLWGPEGAADGGAGGANVTLGTLRTWAANATGPAHLAVPPQSCAWANIYAVTLRAAAPPPCTQE